MLGREEIEGALLDVSHELDHRGVRARICVVGGAAMVLAFEARFSTHDVDAAVSPTDEVLEVARDVGRRRGIGEDWLDDSAKLCLRVFKDPQWRPVFKVGTIEVVAIDERALLAMKMRASRGRRDQSDIEFLLRRCRLTDEASALQLYEEYFPEDPLTARALPMLRHALGVNARHDGLARPG